MLECPNSLCMTNRFSPASSICVAKACLNKSKRLDLLRHHYATENINRWVNEGFGFNAKLFYLSKSMGHSVLESTKYYYSLVPGMADILEEKTGMDFESIIPEVDYEKSN